jgi:hypothetical protein
MRTPGMRVGPLLLAVLFLAVLGGGVGYSVGTLTRSSHPGASGPGGGANSNTGSSTESATETGSPTAKGTASASPTRCAKHTEDLANAGPLTRMLYLHTAQSEVWVCKAGNGKLYYQGHRGPPGEILQEGVNALYLVDVQQENGGYVATNTDPNNGRITKYHVTTQRLVIEYQNYASPKPNDTENAV